MLLSRDCVTHARYVAFPVFKRGDKPSPERIRDRAKDNRNVVNRVCKRECDRCCDTDGNINALVLVFERNLCGGVRVAVRVLKVVGRFYAVFVQDIDNALLN